MTIRKKALDRRTFLRGSGVCISLPLLDAMIPAFAKAAGEQPFRLAIIYIPNGAYTNPEQWSYNDLLQPIKAHASQCSLVANLHNQGGEAESDGPGDHGRAAATYLTGTRVRKDNGQAGQSFDQLVADKLQGRTRVKSLELAMEGNFFEDSGYPSITKNLSWRNESTPRPPITNPRQAFELLFAEVGNSNGASSPALQQAYARRKSILDLVKGEISGLRGKLGQADQTKLDQHLSAIRDYEGRSSGLNDNNSLCMTRPQIDLANSESYLERVHLMMDIMVLAFECDITRIITLSLGQEGSGIDFSRYTEARGGWHNLSHHTPSTSADYLNITRLMSEHFNYYLNALQGKKTPDGGSLLDQSLVTFGAGIADGNRHNDSELPMVLAGKGSGFTPGTTINLPQRTALANFWLGLAELGGLGITSLGRYGTKPVFLE